MHSGARGGPAEKSEPARILFAMWDGGGNVPPLLAIAKTLIAKGHQVRVVVGPMFMGDGTAALAAKVEAAGCTLVPFRAGNDGVSARPATDGVMRSLRTGLAHLRFIRAGFAVWAENIAAELRREPADVVAVDYMLPGALASAEAAGVPAAALMHTIYSLPAPGIPPLGPGFAPARGPIGGLRDAIVKRAIAVALNRIALPALNTARRTLRRQRLRSFFEQYHRADRVLVLTSPAFDFRAGSLPSNVRYTGMPFEDATLVALWEAPWPADDARPLVLVSLSTTPQGQAGLLRRLLEALAGLPVRGLVTLGPAIDPESLTPPDNVVLEPWVPHDLVLPETAVVVTHCGHGTVMAALAHGVPLVCVPMGRDQHDVAARVVLAGAGVRLPQGAKPSQLGKAVQRVLAEPGFRKGAKRIAEAMSGENGALAAALELESLALVSPTQVAGP